MGQRREAGLKTAAREGDVARGGARLMRRHAPRLTVRKRRGAGASGKVPNMASERKTKLSKNLLRMKVRGLGVAGVSDGAAELRDVPK